LAARVIIYQHGKTQPGGHIDNTSQMHSILVEGIHEKDDNPVFASREE
jgi:hypothetical protein